MGKNGIRVRDIHMRFRGILRQRINDVTEMLISVGKVQATCRDSPVL
jgi:hypothetical protein